MAGVSLLDAFPAEETGHGEAGELGCRPPDELAEEAGQGSAPSAPGVAAVPEVRPSGHPDLTGLDSRGGLRG